MQQGRQGPDLALTAGKCLQDGSKNELVWELKKRIGHLSSQMGDDGAAEGVNGDRTQIW